VADRESPLVACAVQNATTVADSAVVVSERPFLGHLNLHGDLDDETFHAAVKTALGFSVPVAPNTVTESKQAQACWLGPNEWLIICAEDRRQSLLQELSEALRDLFAAVTDISAGQTIIRIGGDCAREVISKGCTLDLHPRVFNKGQCAQSGIAKVSVLIRHVDDVPTFDVVVRRSFAEYLWMWFKDAAAEYL